MKLTRDNFDGTSLCCGHEIRIIPDTESGDYESTIKQVLKNQEIVDRLKRRYDQFGDLTVGEMTIRSWTPGDVTSLLEEILGNTTDAGESYKWPIH